MTIFECDPHGEFRGDVAAVEATADLVGLEDLDCTVSNENSPPLTARCAAVELATQKQQQAEEALRDLTSDRAREEELILEDIHQIEDSHAGQVKRLSEEIVSVELQKSRLEQEVQTLKVLLQQLETKTGLSVSEADARKSKEQGAACAC